MVENTLLLFSAIQLTHWHWFSLSGLLFIAELLFSTGGFLFWTGLAGLIMGIITWIFPTLPWGIQLVGFSIFAIGSCVLWEAYFNYHSIQTDDRMLNRRASQYIGRTFELIEPIQHGRGKIRADGVFWVVSGPDLPVFTLVEVVDAQSSILSVIPKTIT